MNVLDLFSGIGGFSLGLERAGFRTVAFCECEPYARRVLAQHWPDVSIYDDVRSLNADRLRTDGIGLPDVITGGFPCQDISLAGRGAGLEGARSSLWFEYLRIIDEVRPSWVIAENVSALRSRGLDTVLRGLASIGYDAEWHCIPAAAVGATHRRDRIWIVGYPQGVGWGAGRPGRPADAGQGEPVSIGPLPSSDPDSTRLAQREGERGAPRPKLTAVVGSAWWQSEPAVGRVAHGVPHRVDRLRCLGNAVVPQIPEIIGRAILQRETEWST